MKRFRLWLANLIVPKGFILQNEDTGLQQIHIQIRHKESAIPELAEKKAKKELLDSVFKNHVWKKTEFDIMTLQNITQYSLYVQRKH